MGVHTVLFWASYGGELCNSLYCNKNIYDWVQMLLEPFKAI